MIDGTYNPIGKPGTLSAVELDAAYEEFGRALAPRYAPDGTYREVWGAGQMTIDVCRTWEHLGKVVDWDVVAGQLIHEAAALQSTISREKNNPSGLGAENDDPYRKANAFHHMYYGMVATVAHWLCYFEGEGPWAEFDPRAFRLRELGWMGVAKKLTDLNRRWAYPGESYGQALANVATELKRSYPGVGGVYVPNPIIQADNIYGVKFRVSIIPKSNPNRTNQPWTAVRPPVIHETANFNPDANAEMHRRFVHNGGGAENVSFQFVVDSEEIIQLIPLYEAGVHAGNHACNFSRPGIELCVNANFNKVMEHGAKLVRFLGEYDPQMAGDPIMVQHFNCSGKNCPLTLRSGRWDEFMAMVQGVKPPEAPDPNAESFVYPGDGQTYWIVNGLTQDGEFVAMLDFFREEGGVPKLGYPREGMRRRDDGPEPVYIQVCENVTMECWLNGFGNMPGPFYRFGWRPV